MQAEETWEMTGWIGVDLDGTLAHYDRWRGDHHVGEAIQPMVDRIRNWLDHGRQVRIVTARVGPSNPNADISEAHIRDWLVQIFGPTWGSEIPITASKDFSMVELWDDRAVQVVPNTGEPVAPDRVRSDVHKPA